MSPIVFRSAALLGLGLVLVLGRAPTGTAEEESAAAKPQPFVSGPLLNPIVPRRTKAVGRRVFGFHAIIDRGLAWLAAHQEENGAWGVRTHAQWCNGERLAPKDQEEAIGLQGFGAATTALALSAFMEAGYIPQGPHPYAETMRRGLDLLMALQSEDGAVGVPEKSARKDTSGRWIYSHAFGSWALVRAYGLTGLSKYRAAAQRALDFSAHARNPHLGWRYGVKPGDNDTSVTACMLMAFHTAQQINLRIEADGVLLPLRLDPEAFVGALAWVEKISVPRYGRSGYTTPEDGPARYEQGRMPTYSPLWSRACAAMAVMIRHWCGAHFEELGKLRWRAWGLTKPIFPKAPSRWMDLWDLWFSALVLRTWGTEEPGHRIPIRRSQLEATKRVAAAQVPHGSICDRLGSWNPIGPWGRSGGRVYSTSLSLMIMLRAGSEDMGRNGQVAIFGDKEQPLEKRLRALRYTRGPLSKDAIKALRVGVLSKQRDLRLGCAETVSRFAPDDRSLRKALRKRLGREEDAKVRIALLWALHRVGPGKKSDSAFLQALAPESDAGGKFLRAYVQQAASGTLSPEHKARYDHLQSGERVLRHADRFGQLPREERAARAGLACWRLLDELDLPAWLDSSPGMRLPLLKSAHFRGAGVVEALEDLLTRKVWLAGGKTADLEALHATVLGGASAAPAHERAFLQVVLALQLVESIRWAQTNVILSGSGKTVGELQAHGFKTLDTALAYLKTVREKAAGPDAVQVKQLGAFLSALAVLRRFDLIEIVTPEGVAAMISSPLEIGGARELLEGTLAGRFLSLASIRLGITLSRLGGASEDSTLMLFEGVAAGAREEALLEASTVDGRRAVVRALLLVTVANGIALKRGAKISVEPAEYLQVRARLPGLGQTAAEVDLLLAWSQEQKALGRSPDAKGLAEEARARAAALGDKDRLAQADELLK